MAEYVLDHHLEGERSRLALMSRLLDPMRRRHIESLGAGPGARVLEVARGSSCERATSSPAPSIPAVSIS